MREDAVDLSLIVDDLVGPTERPSGAGEATPWAPSPADRTTLHQLIEWVSDEVFGQTA